MKPEPLHVREVQNAILNLRSLAETLFETEKPYEPILKEVLRHQYSDEGWPTMKFYEQKLGLKPGKAKQMLGQIFNDLMTRVRGYNEPRYNITDHVHHINVQYFEKIFGFICRLPVTPGIGDQVEYPFLHAVFGTSNFHVHNIQHEFENTTQTITLWLEHGQYNVYKKFYEDKEEFERGGTESL